MKNLFDKIYGYVRTDGLLHILASIALTAFLCVFFNMVVACIVAMAIGFLKEYYDRNHNGTPEWHDIICDAIGIVIGCILVIML